MRSFIFILFLLRFLMPGLAMAGAYNYSSMDFINQGSAQVGRNYIKNGGGEVNKIGWSTFADAASSTPADGTGGSPNSTWTTTTSSPLRGSGSFLWTKSSGASRQGEGVSYDFTIDSSDKGKVLQIKFDYAIASGTFADDDMTAWVYDVTNATMIQPAPYKLKNHSLASETFGLEFQTATTSTSYRLILYVPVTTNSANTVKFDNFSVGPANLTRGPPVTDWVAFTPTLNSNTSVSSNTAFYRRVGDSVEVEGQITYSGAGDASTLTVSLPTGFSIDTAKITSSTKSSLGSGWWADSGTGFFTLNARANTSTTIAFYQTSGTGSFNSSVTANLDEIRYFYKVPISGWSSSAIMSSDADTRVVALETTGTSTSVTSSVVDIVPTTVTKDTHGGMSSATYTVPVQGFYNIEGTIRSASVAWTVGQSFFLYYSINGGSDVELGFSYAQATITTVLGASGSTLKYLNAGDTIKFRAYSAVTNTPGAFRGSIFRLSGPAQIAASETVAARYYVSASTANTSFADDVAEIVDADTKVYDTHGAVTTGAAWKFTMPMAGKYHACIRQRWANGTNLADTDGFIYKNGSIYAGAFGSPTASVYDHNGCVTVSGVAGDYLQWYANQNDSAAGARNIATTGNSFIDIYRIGN